MTINHDPDDARNLIAAVLIPYVGVTNPRPPLLAPPAKDR
jgi:hypothetical protein